MTDISNTKILAQEGGQVPIWQRHCFVSLYDIVKQFDSSKLFYISQALEGIVYNCADNQRMGHTVVHDENKSILLSHLDSILELITELPLNASVKQVERIKTVLSWPNPTYEHIMRLAHELQN